MGLFSKIKKKIKRVFGGDRHKVQAPPPPAPELELSKVEGEAQEKVDTKKQRMRKGKKALKISKGETPVPTTGRNIV